MIEFFGKLTGFLILGLIAYLLFKNKGSRPDLFNLIDGEEIIQMAKGDYWVKELLWQESQNSGEFAFTNKRILFKGTFLKSADKEVSIPYSEILSVEKSFVGLFFPVAFTIKTKDNKSYKFAIMKRHIYIDLINSLAQKSE